MNLTSIPAFQDNYIWVLNDDSDQCIIVDPGEAGPVLETLSNNHWQPMAILLTHHHQDHVGGVKELLREYPSVTVYGPQETHDKGATCIVAEGDKVTISGCEFKVIATPGHTLGHISYFSSPYLFCGDTLFSGGCGRLFEGTPEQMYVSFQKLNELPAETWVCCGHEYTLSNLEFARSVLPQNADIERYYREIKELRAKNGVSVPTKLALERKINVFLRTQDTDLQRNNGFDIAPPHAWDVFALLRQKKDHF